MNKIAVFGKPGSGKSTLSKALAAATGIPLYQLDSIGYKRNGEPVDRESFDAAHEKILVSERWIIDGFGPIGSFNKRLEAADTLIYVNLPYVTNYWLVTKRLLKGMFVKPEGWPSGSSVLKGTLQSYKTLRLCPKFWNDEFRRQLNARSVDKNLYMVESFSELTAFVRRYIE